MVQHHKWGYEAIENMMAWERQIHVSLTMLHLKEENEKRKLEAATRKM